MIVCCCLSTHIFHVFETCLEKTINAAKTISNLSIYIHLLEAYKYIIWYYANVYEISKNKHTAQSTFRILLFALSLIIAFDYRIHHETKRILTAEIHLKWAQISLSCFPWHQNVLLFSSKRLCTYMNVWIESKIRQKKIHKELIDYICVTWGHEYLWK